MRQDDEDIQDLQTKRRDCEEINGYQLSNMIAKKRHPSLSGLSLLRHQSRNRPARKSQTLVSRAHRGYVGLPRWDWRQPWFGPTCESPNTLVGGLAFSAGTVSTSTV